MLFTDTALPSSAAMRSCSALACSSLRRFSASLSFESCDEIELRSLEEGKSK